MLQIKPSTVMSLTKKKFSMVTFSDDSNRAVPSSWLIQKKKKILCYWPSEDLELKIRDCVAPSPHWKTYVVTNIVATSNSQARCEEKGYVGAYPSSATEDDSARSTIDTQLPCFQVSSLVQSCNPPSSSRNECTLTEVMGMLHKVASNVNDLQTGLKRISNQQEELADILSKKFKKLEHRSVVFEQKLDEVRKPQPASKEPLPGPAKTVEELDALVKQLELPVALKGLVRVSVSESVRRILKRLFTRELAMQFSFSGLGHRRQQSKIAFKDHSAMRIIHEGLAAGGFTNHKEVAVATQRGLRGSVDWDGSRHHRGTGATEAAGIATTTNISATTVSTDTVPTPSITYAAELVPSSDLVESDSEISV